MMEYCNYTLKDILEREWVFNLKDEKPTVNLIHDKPLLGNFKSNETNLEARKYLGYSLLKELSYLERVEVGLPFFLSVARGLLTLHASNLLHHDVKPGNVFVQKDRSSFNVLLGDFSFIVQAAAQGSTEAILKDVINTETPHFRSPEQRDFSEVYQAQVLHSYGTNQRFALRIADPKFNRSIVNEQDRLVFSADEQGMLFTIESVTPEAGQLSWIILLRGEDASLQNKFPDTGKPTQVIIYKIPSMASDIFGFGALLYDFLSCGKSAERFYEVVRSIDHGSYRKSIDQVAGIYKMYLQKNSIIEDDDSSLREIFGRFRDDKGDFCPPAMVEIILSCMCSKLDGSYSKSQSVQTKSFNSTPFENIERKIRTLGSADYSSDHVLFAPDKSKYWIRLSSSYLASIGKKQETQKQETPQKPPFWRT